MKLFLTLPALFVAISSLAQIDTLSTQPKVFEPNFTAVDSLYREDQFYVSFTYNILAHSPKNLNQNKFSIGLSGGFLRDVPLNKKRNFAIALGLGYSLQSYSYNLFVSKLGQQTQYELLNDDISYDKNKLSVNYIDIPFEIRWRTSVPQTHKFWRVYTGLKASFLFNSRSKFTGTSGKIVVENDKDVNTFRMSTYFSAGYNTWNFYACYGLNPIFKSGYVNGKSLDVTNLSLGLMFYIL